MPSVRSALGSTPAVRPVVPVVIAGLLAAACGVDRGLPTAPQTRSGPTDSIVSFPGFDISVFPGMSAMSAWKYPASPFRWVGYYLYAPCHRDSTWTGQYHALTTAGWGVAAIYVGQQDWTQIPPDVAPLDQRAVASIASQRLVTCSSSLLSRAQGALEAVDAITRLRADGFPDRSAVFLDVEYVTSVSPALLDYIGGWIAAVLQDGHYTPGVYAATANAQTVYDAASALYHTAGRADSPPFWIASSANFSLYRRPSDVGFAFAQLWQGDFDVQRSYNGVTLTVDIDIASKPSPSAP
jgi:hypothetical protein